MTRGLQPNCTYPVQAGDTLFAIARDFNVSVSALRAVNRGLRWHEGTALNIPGHECLLGQPAPAKQPTRHPALVRRPTATQRGMHDAPPPTCPPLPIPPPGYYWKSLGGCKAKLYPLFAETSTGGPVRPGLHDAVGAGDVPQTVVLPNTPVKVQVQSTASTLPNAVSLAAIRSELAGLGYTVQSIDSGSIFSPYVSVVLSAANFSPLWLIAVSVFNACVTNGAAGSYSGVTASIYGVAPVNPSGPVPIVYGQVNPGDQVKVTALATTGALGGAQAAAQTSALLANRGYAVINLDVGTVGHITPGPVYVLLQATGSTSLPTVAADVNQAMSAGGFSVSQGAGSVYANIYSRGNAPLAPGVPVNNYNPSGVPTPPGSFLDDIANQLSTTFKVPLTAGVVAGILVVGALIFLKT